MGIKEKWIQTSSEGNQESAIVALKTDLGIWEGFDSVALRFANTVGPAVPLRHMDLGCFCFDGTQRFSSARLPVVHVAHERRILPRVENR